MEIWELENIIHDLQIKLDYLSEKVEDTYRQSYGTDIKYGYGERTRGSKSEIEAVKAQIAQYQQTLERKKADQHKRENETKPELIALDAERTKKQEEYQSKKEAELERLETFKQVKAAYKQRKGYGFQKFMDRLNGKAPKWKRVREYTQEELDFALKSLSGETSFMKNRNKNETNAERITNRNWRNFINILNKKYSLKQQMELEESGLRL